MNDTVGLLVEYGGLDAKAKKTRRRFTPTVLSAEIE